MIRDVGAYCTLVALVFLLFLLTTQDTRLRELPSAVLHEGQRSRISTVNEYFTDLEQRLSRFRQNTGYAIKLVEAYGVDLQDLGVLAAEQLSLLQKDYPESKGSVVVVVLTTGEGSAIETSETLRNRFPKQEVERKITAILQGRSSQTLTTERVEQVG